MKTYDNYGDSGNEWIGELPTHWIQKKLKHLATVQPSNVDKKSYEGELPTLLCNYMDVYKNDFILASLNFMEATATPDEIKKFKVDEGDVLVTKDSETADDIAIPAFVKDKLDGVTCGYHLTQIKPNKEKLLGGYLFRLFQTPRFNNQFKVYANGVTRYGLSIYYFSNAVIPLPSVSEQESIIKFLDDKTSKIDNLMLRKRDMIALLEEEKTAVINDVVTKGLNIDAPMKNSGIEWLGMVPEHWQVKKLKYITNQIIDGAHFTPTYVEEGVPFLRVTDVQSKDIDLKNVKRIPLKEHQALVKRCQPQKGDLLLSKNGTIGITKVVDWDWDFSVFVSLCLIKFKVDLISPYYFSFFFQSDITNQQIAEGSKKTSVTNLHLEKINELFIVLPPIAEQHIIINYLNGALGKIRHNIKLIEKEIELMQEYRTALISEAVTGKIDVRDYQPEPINSQALELA
ncbi:restriction endonuclease subunit S [Rufibacter sp. XAAS-G3-1]|uniref:restriction endonuclease subunit S n=1 Tax=Rufibacter sp. XAAS-G3-1 TaxID=2729134 RepID=UPI0015E6E440|nr:restriction endonuclease subunit S [Rufibacter sp. XAAS-G3-1]